MEWNDETKPWLKNLLAAGELTVVFTKKDGTERTMLCTRNMDLIPANTVNEERSKKHVNPDVLPVYDIKEEGWRSFRYDSIKEIIFS